MSDNNRTPLPFKAPDSGVAIVGQPFYLTMVRCLVDAILTCNCGGALTRVEPHASAELTTVEIHASEPSACPSCGRIFNMAFNPTTAKLEIVITMPTKHEVPS